jgi:hypothetical protein
MFNSKANTAGRVVAVLCALLMICGCEDSDPTEPEFVEPSAQEWFGHSGSDRLTVMTRNLYVGAPVEALFSTELPLPVAAWQLWQQVKATNYPERAEAMADEIAGARPHLIGLNEVSYFDVQTTAGVETLDFLPILLNELAERGVDYVPVAQVQNFAGQVPLFDPETGVQGAATLVDFDFILARGDVTVSDPQAANFDNVVVEVVDIPGMGQVPIPILRGWASIDAVVDGFAFRFVVSHLEPGEDNPDVQEAQGFELMAALENEELPIVLVGDMNSAANRTTTPTYGNFIDIGGYVDTWNRLIPGYTCCQQSDLLNWRSVLDKRVDLILVSGDFELWRRNRRAVRSWLVGNRFWDKTPSGLWPSDHAGVITSLRLSSYEEED